MPGSLPTFYILLCLFSNICIYCIFSKVPPSSQSEDLPASTGVPLHPTLSYVSLSVMSIFSGICLDLPRGAILVNWVVFGVVDGRVVLMLNGFLVCVYIC